MKHNVLLQRSQMKFHTIINSKNAEQYNTQIQMGIILGYKNNNNNKSIKANNNNKQTITHNNNGE